MIYYVLILSKGKTFSTPSPTLKDTRFGYSAIYTYSNILFLIFFKSLAIADAVYIFFWYKKPVQIQKYVILILLRSQRPLTLKACGVKVMSLATFLGVRKNLWSQCCSIFFRYCIQHIHILLYF